MAASEGYRDAAFLILTSLTSGAKHGYAVMSDVADFAGVRLGPGTLYTALQRLEADGLIEPIASEDRRRPYRITPQGLRLLREHADLLQRVARVASRRLVTL